MSAPNDSSGGPRADFKKQPVFVKATIADQAGHRPGYRRQWFHAKDPQSNRYFGRFLQEQFVGDREVGHCKAAPWTVVSNAGAKPGRKRDDDTVGIDTALTHGDLVCLETPEDNAAIWDEYNRLRDGAQAKRLQRGDSEAFKGADGRWEGSYRAGISTDPSKSHTEILKEG